MAKQRGPTITTDLYSARTDQLKADVERKASDEASRAVQGISNFMVGQIQEAYMRGLQDGFAQGVYSAGPGCKCCAGSGLVFHYGNPDTMTADLMHCSECGDGEKVCGTDLPCVTSGGAHRG